MNYQETLDFMFGSLPMYQRQGKAAYKANLDNSIAFDNHLSNPHRAYKTIHIAGTNGKGSTSHMLASILQESGYKVGLYTSPHLKDFRERIKVNGEMVSEVFVVDFIAQNRDFIDELKPSFFEMTVFMAFEYFKHSGVDVAVIETGMGGRLDSTNLIVPELSIITNISLDHTQFLGDTIEKIAIEKAGIIKASVPVVVGESREDYNSVFNCFSEEKHSSLVYADEQLNIPYVLKSIDNKQVFDVYKGDLKLYEQLELDLMGHYQQKNVLTCLSAIEELKSKFEIKNEAVRQGLSNVIANTQLLGRWQTLGSNPQIICDTGHNEAGVNFILSQIEQTAFEKLHLVWGMVNDKSIDKILKKLPEEAKYYFCKANIPRALEAGILKAQAEDVGLRGNVYSSVNEALMAAKKDAKTNDLIFVGGSTFVVAEVV
jgi:dihydrofolate synthase/folylpolyglutamate synthase